MFTSSQLQSLFRYACVLTVNEQTAHDLVQDAVEKCLRKPPRNNEALMSYSRKIIHNRFVDSARRDKRFPHTSLDDELIELDTDNRLLEEMVIDANELDKIWIKLEPIEREILFLWAVEEYSTSQIAEQIEMPRGTILARIHRLRKRLKNNNHDTQYLDGAV